MANIIEAVTGDLSEKKRFRAIQKRVKALPADYRVAYEEIQKYMWATSGIETIQPFEALVELFEEGAAEGRHPLDITGDDVAAFADELARGEKGYFAKRRDALNQTIAAKLGRAKTI